LSTIDQSIIYFYLLPCVEQKYTEAKIVSNLKQTRL